MGWLRDTGGPKRCGTCGVVRSAQSAGRVDRKIVLAVCSESMLSKELRECVEVADDDVPVCLVVKSVRRDRRATSRDL